MITMFAKHKVNDFDAWKRTYDEFAPVRKKMGVTGASVHRDARDPNIVTVTHTFNSLDAATAFAGSDDLKSAMKNAGVVGAPDIWFAEGVEQTAF
jgi:quinol monooxygenase YgiN